MKVHFIPSKENGYKPKILRNEFFFAFLGLIIAIEAVYLTASFVLSRYGGTFTAAVITSTLVDLTNERRVSASVGKLSVNPRLQYAAELKARDMAKRGYFSHKDPSGAEPWGWLEKTGYVYSYAGENLAVLFSESKDVADAWMNSPAHRDNLLNGNFREVGIGVANGQYEGKNATFVVQFLGTPPNKVVLVSKTPVIPGVVKPEEKIIEGAGANVLAASVSVPEQGFVQQETLTWYEKIVGSLRDRVSDVYVVLGLFFAFSLILAIVIKFKIQHREIIRNGAILIAVVTFVIYANVRLLSRAPYISDTAVSEMVTASAYQ